jgi:hypothetical protein
MTNDNDLIRRGDAKAACQGVADSAKAYSIPQMALGASACRDAMDTIPAATPALDAAAMQRMAAEAALSVNAKAFRERYMVEYAKKRFDQYSLERNVNQALNIQAEDASEAILALPLPTPADRLADARKLPEVAALVEAAKNASDTWLRHGGFSDGQMDDVRAALRPFTGEGR